MRLKLFLTLSLLLGIVSGASAVTDGEMEQARAITAKNYLRWVNNGSGYLDDVKELPKSMGDLKKILKAKELENLKKFEAVAVPKDYASWDKAKLVSYWSETFLSSPGLDPVGKGSHSRTAKHIGQLKISEPSKEAPKPAEPAPAAPVAEPAAEPAAPAEAAPATDPQADEIAGAMAAGSVEETLPATETEEADKEEARPKKSNSTWIYVGILIFLVIVVVGLVIYAARAMKHDGDEDPDDSDEIGGSGRSKSGSSESETPAYVPSDSVSRKEHEFMIERKNEKIRKVKAELDVLREENARLQASHDTLQNRLTQAQTQIESLRLALSEAENKAARNASAPAAVAPSAPAQRPVRSLYLGRVNKNGLFVRADRQLNEEATVYRLDTEDGYTGSFRVVNTPAVVGRALDNPAQWLEGGCAIDDTVAADEAGEIVTETSGTAVLEDGCWKLVRKAKVRYV